jgi:hypothetical protein
MSSEVSLGSNCRSHGAHRGREGGEERITLGPNFDSATLGDRITKDGGMLILNCSITDYAEILKESRRSLDIGEHEGDRSGRKLGHWRQT